MFYGCFAFLYLKAREAVGIGISSSVSSSMDINHFFSFSSDESFQVPLELESPTQISLVDEASGEVKIKDFLILVSS